MRGPVPSLGVDAAIRDAQRKAAEALLPLAGVLAAVGDPFAAAGHDIALVGGPVRDALLGRMGAHHDLDFTTSARPDEIIAVLTPVADAIWDVGIRFGTVGARVAGREVEITTYRAESYDPQSRKPEVDFGDSLVGDLGRRDFSINAMAIRLPDLSFVDLFDGLGDLGRGLIRTPGRPEDSFSDEAWGCLWTRGWRRLCFPNSPS